MTARVRIPARVAAVMAAGLLLVMGGAPAAAEVYRTCAAEFVLRPSTPRLEEARSAAFSAVGRHAADDVAARRDARHRLEVCARDHWADPHADAAPASCGGGGPRTPGLIDYPLANLLRDATALSCAANPGVDDIWIDIQIHVRGGEGCTPPPDFWAIDLGRGVRIHCPQPATIVPLPRLERLPEQPRTIAPQPEFRPVAGPPMPGVRLPGHDIGGEWLGMDGTWRDCLELCRDTDGCNAWTYRRPGTTPGRDEAGCLLKSRAGERVSDTCCHSGIME